LLDETEVGGSNGCIKQLNGALDATITVTAPKGALDQAKRDRLMKRLSDTLLKYEGADIASKAAQDIAWTYYVEVDPGFFYVGGAPSSLPRLKIEVTTPQGQVNDVTRTQLAIALGAIVAEEAGPGSAGGNHWVLFHEITDGHWATANRIFRRADIIAAVRGPGLPA
jgi:phenylpyruvate tautomerase PptA (4-oxalocrotonate tautomerase family)